MEKQMKSVNNKEQIRKLVTLSLLTAVAYLSIYLIHFKVQFLTFDVKNVFITIAAMIFGPIAGIVISLVAAVLELLLFSTTGFYGFVMNFLSSASFAAVAALIYRGRRTVISSYLSLFSASLVSTAVMLVANLFITPYYMGVSITEVAEMIPKLFFPFNLLKCLVNAALILIFYKPISFALRRSKMIQKEKREERYFNQRTVISLVAALTLIAASLVVFFLVLGGKISFG